MARRDTTLWLRGPAALGVLAFSLTACGGEAVGEDEQVELRFTWWGGDGRHQYTQEIIDAFEEEHPNITVHAEFDAWDGYWDSLATQTAAQDTPDIIQMDLMYIREYIENGILLELDEVDTSAFTEELLETGSHEGQLYGMPVGSAASTLVANTEVFEEAGAERPDDQTWTWEELGDLAAEIAESTGGYGQARPFGDAGFELWLRQHQGVNLLTEEGALAWEPEQAEPYFEMLEEMSEAGALPSASEIVEDRTAAHEETFIATGQAAIDGWWDTNIVALSSGDDAMPLEPLMMPSQSGSASDAEMYYKASMFYSVYAGTDHPEEAQLFVDFLVNSEEAGQLQLIERGIPGNEDIRELIREDLDEVESAVLEYSESIEDLVADAPPMPPEGFGAVQEIIWRYEEEFLFGRASAQEAAERMHGEIEGAVG